VISNKHFEFPNNSDTCFTQATNEQAAITVTVTAHMFNQNNMSLEGRQKRMQIKPHFSLISYFFVETKYTLLCSKMYSKYNLLNIILIHQTKIVVVVVVVGFLWLGNVLTIQPGL
jgi:hypothetical protein